MKIFTNKNNSKNKKYRFTKKVNKRKLNKQEKKKRMDKLRDEILNGSPWSLMSSYSSESDGYREIVSAIDNFNYSTEREQTFTSKENLQAHLEKNINILRESVDKYIEKRSKNVNKAMIKS